jgi:hypothetical protein
MRPTLTFNAFYDASKQDCMAVHAIARENTNIVNLC